MLLFITFVLYFFDENRNKNLNEKKKYNMVLIEKQLKYQHYYQIKLKNMNSWQAKK